jgi:AraC-like DNA-binding protein
MPPNRKKIKPPKIFKAFESIEPFHGIIHNYVDLNCFLIGPSLPSHWRSLNRRMRTNSFYELEKKYSNLAAKGKYLEACINQSKKGRKSVCGSYLGFRDMIVPVFKKKKILGFLVAGAFVDHELMESDVRACWKGLTKSEASTSNTDFQELTRTLLDIPVLDEALQRAYLETLELFAQIIAGEKELEPIKDRLNHPLRRIFPLKLPHSFFMNWALGQPTSESVPAWSREIEGWDWVREEIGITRVPTTVIAVIPRAVGKPLDPLAAALRIYRFQRHSFHFSKTLPETLGGKLENYGAVFVTSANPDLNQLQRRRQIQETAEKIHNFATKELGGPALVGIGETVPRGETLSESFRQAVLAIHLGRQSGREIVTYDTSGEKGRGGLPELHRVLSVLAREFSAGTLSNFEILRDGFLRRVLTFSLQNPEEIRWHLQYALMLLTDAVQKRVDWGEKEANEIYDRLALDLEKAVTTHEMVLAFKGGLDQLAERTERRSGYSSANSIQRVRDFVDDHYGEPLKISRLAKMAGVSVSTFSRYFKKLTGIGLEPYLQNRRLDEAKRLLRTSSLPVSRIGRDCGFKSYTYFVKLFGTKTGFPPQKFRKKSQTA